ncbi:MAG: hypothetical protein K2X86_10950 [Cytophagaceae bacterium]|nr:hypothetical protein [Cytophagaceae bacterium]
MFIFLYTSIDTRSNMEICDFKALTLELFGKEILISVKTDSPSYQKYGDFIKGKLTGRIWGEDEDTFHTVTAISVFTEKGEVEIECEDILSVKDITDEPFIGA